MERRGGCTNDGDLSKTSSRLFSATQSTYHGPVIRNVIFDWSGTLVNDLPAVLQATNHVFAQAGKSPLSLEQFRAEFQLPFKGFYDRFVPHVSISQLEVWFHGRFREVQDLVEALPHAREFLEFCRRQKVRTFVLSTVHHEHFAVQAARTGFDDFIDHPYLGVWDKRARIGEILRDHDVDPRETLFIGDMEHDIETARHGGVHSCAVLTGYNDAAQLRRSQPDLIVEHLGELQSLLDRSQFRLFEDTGEAGRPGETGPVATVGALIFDGANRVLMIRTHKWSNLWGIPGGKIKRGEPSERAVAREIKEETNLDVADVRFVLVQDCIHSREFYKDAHFILLNYTCRCGAGQEVVLNEEAQEYRWVPLEEAFQLPLNQPTLRLLRKVQVDMEENGG